MFPGRLTSEGDGLIQPTPTPIPWPQDERCMKNGVPRPCENTPGDPGAGRRITSEWRYLQWRLGTCILGVISLDSIDFNAVRTPSDLFNFAFTVAPPKGTAKIVALPDTSDVEYKTSISCKHRS